VLDDRASSGGGVVVMVVDHRALVAVGFGTGVEELALGLRRADQ